MWTPSLCNQPTEPYWNKCSQWSESPTDSEDIWFSQALRSQLIMARPCLFHIAWSLCLIPSSYIHLSMHSIKPMPILRTALLLGRCTKRKDGRSEGSCRISLSRGPHQSHPCSSCSIFGRFYITYMLGLEWYFAYTIFSTPVPIFLQVSVGASQVSFATIYTTLHFTEAFCRTVRNCECSIMKTLAVWIQVALSAYKVYVFTK